MDKSLGRDDVAALCLSYPGAFEDYPFRDKGWCTMRHSGNRRVFAWLFTRHGQPWVNLKCTPDMGLFWRKVYASVGPAYHLNKEHWISVVLDGSVPAKDIAAMVEDSFQLTLGKG